MRVKSIAQAADLTGFGESLFGVLSPLPDHREQASRYIKYKLNRQAGIVEFPPYITFIELRSISGIVQKPRAFFGGTLPKASPELSVRRYFNDAVYCEGCQVLKC